MSEQIKVTPGMCVEYYHSVNRIMDQLERGAIDRNECELLLADNEDEWTAQTEYQKAVGTL